jgi:hypothetical protein
MLMPEYTEADLSALLEALGPNLASDLPAESFHPIPPSSGRLCAIDGGSAMLFDGGSFTVAVSRAGHVMYDDTQLVSEAVTPMALRLFSSSELDQDGGFLEPISSWRHGLEMEAASRALEDMVSGDTLVLDGALVGAGASPSVQALMAQASEREIHIAGVSKRTRLLNGGKPAVIRAVLSAEACGVDPPWHLPLMDRNGVSTSVAMLHGISTFAFRIDHSSPEALGVLSTSSSDPVYPGYPYPLARVHNVVAIHDPIKRAMRGVLADRCRELEGLEDFHEVLDRNW